MESFNPNRGLTSTIKDKIVQALIFGAHGFVRKDSPSRLLFKSIRAVMAGEYWVSHDDVSELVKNLRSLSELVEQKTKLQARSLSRKHLQIIEAIGDGCSNREIAEQLSLNERTVKYHLRRIFSKVGVSGRMELARFSLQHKINGETQSYGTRV